MLVGESKDFVESKSAGADGANEILGSISVEAVVDVEPKLSPEKQESPAVERLFQNILVQGLWACGTDCIIGVCITNVDAKSQ
jgi:hypothetical protein